METERKNQTKVFKCTGSLGDIVPPQHKSILYAIDEEKHVGLVFVYIPDWITGKPMDEHQGYFQAVERMNQEGKLWEAVTNGYYPFNVGDRVMVDATEGCNTFALYSAVNELPFYDHDLDGIMVFEPVAFAH